MLLCYVTACWWIGLGWHVFWKKKCNPKATDEHSPCLHISFKVCSQLYVLWVHSWRAIWQMMLLCIGRLRRDNRDISFARVHGISPPSRGRNGTKSVSLSGSGGKQSKFISPRFSLDWNKRSRISEWLRAGRSGVRIATGENIFCSQEPSGSALGVKRPGNEVDHSSVLNAEVKNEWSYASAPSICRHGVDGDNFIGAFAKLRKAIWSEHKYIFSHRIVHWVYNYMFRPCVLAIVRLYCNLTSNYTIPHAHIV